MARSVTIKVLLFTISQASLILWGVVALSMLLPRHSSHILMTGWLFPQVESRHSLSPLLCEPVKLHSERQQKATLHPVSEWLTWAWLSIVSEVQAVPLAAGYAGCSLYTSAIGPSLDLDEWSPYRHQRAQGQCASSLKTTRTVYLTKKLPFKMSLILSGFSNLKLSLA